METRAGPPGPADREMEETMKKWWILVPAFVMALAVSGLASAQECGKAHGDAPAVFGGEGGGCAKAAEGGCPYAKAAAEKAAAEKAEGGKAEGGCAMAAEGGCPHATAEGGCGKAEGGCACGKAEGDKPCKDCPCKKDGTCPCKDGKPCAACKDCPCKKDGTCKCGSHAGGCGKAGGECPHHKAKAGTK
jgi:hypothetical protein